MKNIYNSFSYYYDEIMQEINYKAMLDFTTKYLNKDSNILDLACGTGTFCINLGMAGYKVTGVDISEKMIGIAIEKAKINRLAIPFYVADITTYEKYNTYCLITCFFDSINMLNSLEKINNLLRLVHCNLKDKGLFIFDVFSKNRFVKSHKDVIRADLGWFKYVWKMRIKNQNKLIHKIKIKEGQFRIKETYLEYYYDYKDLIDTKLFNIIEVKKGFSDHEDSEEDRFVIVLQKKSS